MSAKPEPTPEPTKVAKGFKACPSCKGIIAARAMTCKLCGYEIPPKDKSAAAPRAARTTTQPTEKAEVSLLKVLKGRGFDVKITIDALDDSVAPVVSVEKKLEPIMEFVPSYTKNGKFELSLDQLLTILKLPHRKD